MIQHDPENRSERRTPRLRRPRAAVTAGTVCFTVLAVAAAAMAASGSSLSTGVAGFAAQAPPPQPPPPPGGVPAPPPAPPVATPTPDPDAEDVDPTQPVKPADPVRVEAAGLPYTVTPKRDRSAPYAYVVKARVKLPAGMTAASGCKGFGRVSISRGKHTRRVIKVGRRISAQTCRFRVRLQLEPAMVGGRRSGRMTIAVGFDGNQALRRANPRYTSVRFG